MWWNWHQHWCSNTDTGVLFGQTVKKKNKVHTCNAYGAVTNVLHCLLHALTFWLLIILCALLSTMIPQYNTIPPYPLHACKMAFDYLSEQDSDFIIFQHFDATFNRSSRDITLCKYHLINSSYFPFVRKCDFQKVSTFKCVFWTTLYTLGLTLTKLSGNIPLFPFSSPSHHPSSSSILMLVITSPSLRFNSSGLTASYWYSTTASTGKQKEKKQDRLKWGFITFVKCRSTGL